MSSDSYNPPHYRVTIELLHCGHGEENGGNRIRCYTFDRGRVLVESRIAFATPRYSFDVSTDALSMWIASDRMNWIDGPWRVLSGRKAVAHDLGLPSQPGEEP